MKIISINGNGIEFDNGTVVFDEHCHDCCESHWAAWDEINPNAHYFSEDGGWKTIREMEFPESFHDLISTVEDIGFFLISTEGHKVLVNCYGSNNGYYSTDLTLCCLHDELSYGDRETIDLSSCQDITWEP